MCSGGGTYGDLVVALDQLGAVDLAELPDAALADQLRELTAQASRLQAEILRTTAVFDGRGGGADDGAASTASWLRGRCRLSSREAAGQVRLARALHRRLPATADALAAGSITVAHARVLADGIRDLPDGVVADGEPTLLGAARDVDPRHFAEVVARWRAYVAPDLFERDAEHQHERRHLYASATIGGVVDVKGMLDAEGGAVLLAALSALAGAGGGDDTRTAAERRADALVELARRALDSGDLPDSGGERPHLNVTVDLTTLTSSQGLAELDWTGPVSPTTGLRIACDAAISRVLLAGESQPLDVGRRTRTISAAMRRALVARDRHCRFTECDRPPSWCDGHHVVSWAHGGDTALPNLILLCRRHHKFVHDKHLVITRHPDGSVTFRPPDDHPDRRHAPPEAA